MCGRYRLTSPPEKVAIEFDIELRENFPPRWNIAPAQPIALIRTGLDHVREFALARWGFIPSWAKKDYFDKVGTKPLFNARGETLAEKATFKNAARRRRCLIPADGYYDWRTKLDERKPYLFTNANESLFAFAGVWETAVDPDGGEIDTAAIITIGASADLSDSFSREPVVIAKSHYQLWLDEDERIAKEALPLIRSAPKGFWKCRPVSPDINNARHEGEALALEIDRPV